MTGRRTRLALVTLGLTLAGCAAQVPFEPNPDDTPALMRLASDQALGQTFLSEEAGLNGLEIYLAPEAGAPLAGSLELRLRAGPEATHDLAHATLPLQSVTEAGFYRLAFAPQAGSLRTDYYAALTVSGTGAVSVGTRPGPTYAAGALYHAGEPVDLQLAFRPRYAPVGAVSGMLGGAGRWVWWLLLAALLVAAPGWALLAWLWPASGRLSWGERLGLAAGLGCAPYPLLFLWAHVAGLRLGPWHAWLPLAGGVLGLALLAWRERGALRAALSQAGLQAWWRSGCGWPDLALVGVMAVVVLTRWWAARGLDLPLWGDSVQHTMIVQLVLDHGGLFDAWAPYADLESFTYHFGFHALVAVFHWLSGLPAAQATLWMGQILNCLAVLTLYPLGVRIGGHRWGGVAAVLAAGLLSPHPAYYVNWGRYTQLAGMVLLPTAAYLTWALVGAPRRRGLVALGVLVVAALALAHYRVLLMYGLFVAALLVVEWRRARPLIWPLAALAAGAIALALPWMLRTLGGPLLAFTGLLVTTPAASVSSGLLETAGLPDPRVYPLEFWLLAGAGLVAGWRWRRQAFWLLVAWWVLLVLGAHPAWVGLPGTGVLTNFAVLIAGYVGGALMAAAAAAWLTQPPVKRRWPVWVALLALISVWGTWQRLHAVQVGRDAAPTRADMRAAAWIDRSLPPDARLLTKTDFGFSGTVAVGADAGVWLPLLAHRAVTTPPINYTMEIGPGEDYRGQVEGLARAVEERGVDDPSVLALLHERGVTHVYIGQRWDPADEDESLRASTLLSSGHFRPVYHEDRVWVFEVLP